MIVPPRMAFRPPSVERDFPMMVVLLVERIIIILHFINPRRIGPFRHLFKQHILLRALSTVVVVVQVIISLLQCCYNIYNWPRFPLLYYYSRAKPYFIAINL